MGEVLDLNLRPDAAPATPKASPQSQKRKPNRAELQVVATPQAANYEAEQSVLGAIMRYGDEMLPALTQLTADSFHSPQHSKIFNAFLGMVTRGQNINLVSLVEYLTERHLVDAAGGYVYLAETAETVVSMAAAKQHISLVKELQQRRDLEAVGHRLLEASRNRSQSIGKVLKDATSAISGVGHNTKMVALRPKIISAVDLMNKKLPPLKWAIEGLLPEGLTILGGKPKMGKSWMVLNWCFSVAHGGYALGQYPCPKGEALYIDMECGERLNQSRLRKVMNGQQPPEGLDFATIWPPQMGGGLDYISEYIESHPNLRLVVIDVFQKFRPSSNGRANAYQEDYQHLGAVKDIIDGTGVALVFVHHLRKADAPEDPFEMFSGSTGITGSVDSLMLLKRSRLEGNAELMVTGREIEEINLSLEFQPQIGTWVSNGEAAQVAASDAEGDIIAAFKDALYPLNTKQIAQGAGVGEKTARAYLSRLVKKGILHRPDRGRYALVK